MNEEKITRLDASDGEFSPREHVALEFAEKLALEHRGIDDPFFERLRSHFSDPQILELGMMIGQYIGFGRLLMVLDLEPEACRID